MSRYVLEIGCEEIPARFMPKLLKQFKELWEKQLQAQAITWESVETLGTYRRLCVQITGLALHSEVRSTRLRGPLAAIARGSDGAYLPPGLGFLKKYTLETQDILEEEEQGKVYLVAYKKTEGQPIVTLLPEIIKKTVLGLELPIAMKWGDNQGPFIRPIHWILSLLDDVVVPVELFGIRATNHSYGHRFLTHNLQEETVASGVLFPVSHADSFEAELASHYVMFSEKARAIIASALQGDHDPELLEEVAFLIEWPTPLQGSIDARHIRLPQETIIACMKKHQKFFPVMDQDTLLPSFIVIADSVTEKSRANIIAGNEKVLKARLDDVAFFWEEDQKKSLESKVEKLKTITFQKGLGTLHDKVERLVALSGFLADMVQIPSLAKEQVIRTARLCKADLVSFMVYEMPALQGIMGGIYAQLEGEAEAVCEGIKIHYQPLFQASDPICGVIVGLADKLDTAISCFCNGLIPTGSQDPWAVRRAVYGLIQSPYPLNLSVCIEYAYSLLEKMGKPRENQEACESFFKQRIKTFLSETYPQDIAASVMEYALSDLQEAQKQAQALTRMKQENIGLFKQWVDMAVRVGRLAAHSEDTVVQEHLFELDAEREAYQCFKTCDMASPTELGRLVEAMTLYFDHVLVMDKNAVLKKNRLAFLNTLNQAFLTIFHAEKIAI